MFLKAIAAEAKGSDYYLYDYEIDELGNKKEKTAKKERSKRLLDPTVTQNCRGQYRDPLIRSRNHFHGLSFKWISWC